MKIQRWLMMIARARLKSDFVATLALTQPALFIEISAILVAGAWVLPTIWQQHVCSNFPAHAKNVLACCLATGQAFLSCEGPLLAAL